MVIGHPDVLGFFRLRGSSGRFLGAPSQLLHPSLNSCTRIIDGLMYVPWVDSWVRIKVGSLHMASVLRETQPNRNALDRICRPQSSLRRRRLDMPLDTIFHSPEFYMAYGSRNIQIAHSVHGPSEQDRA